MNGQDHSREAQRLEQLALEQWKNDQPLYALTMQQAQLHASLAQADATRDLLDEIRRMHNDQRRAMRRDVSDRARSRAVGS